MTLAIDASVWISASFEGEPGHAESAEFLLQALGSRESVVLPLLAWIECVAAVARKTGDDALATEFGGHLREIPQLQWIDIGEDMAARAAEVASHCRLRAADAVYVAVAAAHRATLVTLDTEMLDRTSDCVRCESPETWIRGRGHRS